VQFASDDLIVWTPRNVNGSKISRPDI